LSEYQYYEFLAVDRPLDRAAQGALREISSRATITTTSFRNHYDYGDLKADPLKMLADHFDLHVYVANWGSRVFAMRFPKQFIDRTAIKRFGISKELLQLRVAGQHVLVVVTLDELELEEWDDGDAWMAGLAPLREAVLRGDLRLFYLLWLLQVSYGEMDPDDAPEPLAWIGEPDGALGTFADFICLDPDLLTAAASDPAAMPAAPLDKAVKAAIRALPEDEKVRLLFALYEGETPHLSAAFRSRLALPGSGSEAGPRRSAGDLCKAAVSVAAERKAAEAARAAAAKRQRDAAEAKARAARLAALVRRGTAAWDEVEALVAKRNATGYAEAVTLLLDLRELGGDFPAVLRVLRGRHAAKASFIARLDKAGLV
jgi:hypothetical protein